MATGRSSKSATSLPLGSWSGLLAGFAYDTVTVSPAMTASASVSVTSLPLMSTASTVRLALSTATVKADAAGSESVARASSKVSTNDLPSTAAGITTSSAGGVESVGRKLTETLSPTLAAVQPMPAPKK